MAKSDPEVTSRIAPLMLIVAQQRGLDTRAIATRWKLPIEPDLAKLSKMELVTTPATLRGVSEDLALALGDPAFGLTLAAGVPRGTYGVAEFLIRSAPTLRLAFENLIRFNQLVTSTQTYSLVETADEAQVHNVPLSASPTAYGRHINEYATAAVLSSLQAMVDAPVLRAWFINPPPASTARLKETFGTSHFTFDQPTNGYAVDRKQLDAPVRSGDPALFEFLETHALGALASRPKTNDLVDRLRHLMRAALKQGEPNIERLSVGLKMSARTLQRRLTELDTTFLEVLDGVRFDLARSFLREARLDNSHVAYLLGYSELRAFDRAFKRWSGLTPSDYRTTPG